MPTRRTSDHGRQLREALAPYLDPRQLRAIVAAGGDLHHAFHCERPGDIPDEAKLLINALGALLRPDRRESICGPQDVAGMLMVEMGALEQEELRVVVLNTKHHVLDVVTVYRGTINSSAVRVAEVFKAAIRCNAAAIILAHNHPSSDPSPSSEDLAVTREVLAAGTLLGIELLDHLVIGGGGRWVSLRERGLGFGTR